MLDKPKRGVSLWGQYDETIKIKKMTLDQLFSMSAQEVRDNFKEAISCIRENSPRKGGLPSVFHNNQEMAWEITQIKKSSASDGFEVDTDGSIRETGFDRNFCG